MKPDRRMDPDYVDNEENNEDDMNVKHPTGMGYVVIAVVVGLAPQIFMRWFNGVDNTPTQIALVELKTQVANLTIQVAKLTDQPYVRRDEFESRLSGFDRRISDLERQHELPRR
jgi:hypothetical protein